MLVVGLHVGKIDSTTDYSLKRVNLLLHNIIKDQLTIVLLTCQYINLNGYKRKLVHRPLSDKRSALSSPSGLPIAIRGELS